MSGETFLGIDIGTEGARAGIFDGTGNFIGAGKAPFPLLTDGDHIAEYRSSDIWAAVCEAVSGAVGTAGQAVGTLSGIGVDAACSLVADLPDGFSVSPDGKPGHDSIAWLDHRAIGEAEDINQTGADVLAAVGGRISPEMQIPKLLWLKRNRPDVFEAARGFYDLGDWITFRLTGEKTRSACTTVCKWTWSPAKGGWDRPFLEGLGLCRLYTDVTAPAGQKTVSPGVAIGTLGDEAARELGLPSGIPVAACLIDAYAGALGTLGVNGGAGDRLALIAGTSACHIIQTDREIPVPGVWGPYPDVMFAEKWALEAGQSACGALLDTIVARHSAGQNSAETQDGAGADIFEKLDNILADLSRDRPLWELTTRRHILPDVLGNRSPLADPTRQGAISGLGTRTDIEDLALDYLAGLQALALGTRHILEAMQENGVYADEIVVSGSLKSNPNFLQETANATGLPVIVPDTEEPVLLGAAMLGANAASGAKDLRSTMRAMSGDIEKKVLPQTEARETIERKYRVFREMLADQKKYDDIMSSGGR